MKSIATEILAKNRLKSPVKNQPNQSDNKVKSRENPGRFSDLRSFLNLSDSLVRRSNFYKVAEPSVGTNEVTKKKRYKVIRKVKKEEDLVESSSNSIRKYFPRNDNSSICSTGKRKLSIISTEVFKKQRVGEQTMD